ncbi:zinc-dependent alcohol dehydrogenase [Ureibacillus acetophenoni]|uniref:Alcohol dehydrogenase n=1 Tax=Ureibacillus acetophenoni TaxID=614649 RepID=A0A285UIT8_9BACL|nr:alcohol dehydrogenase [Ureibacillus acetophenoni]SOC40516.1 alcohol dehydrogenase [Ureibacillus acetophenoni]
MKALVLNEINKISLQEVEKPQIINPGDAIIRVTLTTICGSDIHLIHGHMHSTPGYVVGHEFVGVVEEVGSDVVDFKPGDRVTGPPALHCGQCDNCQAGYTSHCTRGGILGSGPEMGDLSGTQSEYVRIPFADLNLVHIPENLTDEQVLFVGDILSTGYSAAVDAEIKTGDSVVVFGAGPVGLCAVASAKLFSPGQIILVDMDKSRLEMGRKIGATHVITAGEENVLEVIQQLTNGKGADAALEAAGVEPTFLQAVRCLGVGGRVSLVGIPSKDIAVPFPEIFFKNLTIRFGLGDLKNMKRLIRMVETGQLDLTPLITHRMSLNDIEKGYEIFENRKEPVIKIAVTP